MTEKDKPIASIVVAAYNSASTMARCIEALLAQDYANREVIVVDNASKDATRSIAARYPVRVLDEPRRGWPAARNRAWHYSAAPLVANIDADCFAEPTWLSELVAAILADPHAGCAVGRTKVEPGKSLAQKFYASCDPFNLEKYVQNTARAAGRRCPWGGGNNVFRRDVMEAVGGYDAATYTSGADREYHKRFEDQTAYRTIYAPKALIWHVARGSAAEFFRQSAKFARDAVVHAEFDPGVAAQMNGYVRRNLGNVARCTAGFFWRGAKFLVGRESAPRVAEPIFWSIHALGSVWGHLQGRRRVRRKTQEKKSGPQIHTD